MDVAASMEAAQAETGLDDYGPEAEAMVEALRRKGNPVGYFLFAGEQHGFRQSANIQRCLDAELAFYAIEVFRTGLTF